MNEHTRHFFRMTEAERDERSFCWRDGWFWSCRDEAWVSWGALLTVARHNVQQAQEARLLRGPQNVDMEELARIHKQYLENYEALVSDTEG